MQTCDTVQTRGQTRIIPETASHTNDRLRLTHSPFFNRVSDDDPRAHALFRLNAGRRAARTFVAEVVHEDDLGDELRRRAVEDAVNGAQQRRPALVMEGDDDAGVGKIFCVQLGLTAATHKHSCGHTVTARCYAFL